MLELPIDWSRFRRVLCLGAHCDDIEIGCGAALIELQERAPHLQFHWQVMSGDAERASESVKAARSLLCAGEEPEIVVHSFRGSYFPQCWAELKDQFESLKNMIEPDLIFTHWIKDRHQDHRIVAELTWNTFRDHRILEYEIPKFEGDLGLPNVFFPLSPDAVERKISTLETCFPSQRQRPWFRSDVFRGLMSIRGAECNAKSGFAEAFHGRKMAF